MHEPRKTIEELRNHLASHDRPLLFLFGAGTSSGVNIAPPAQPGEKRAYVPLIPSMAGLTKECETCVSKAGEIYAKAWGLLEEECTQVQKQVNIENILSRVRAKIDAMWKGEQLLGLNKDELCNLETIIRKTIVGVVTPDEGTIPSCLPHKDFALWIKKVKRSEPLEIFTTNYDILIERALESENIPLFDGFVGGYRPFFHPDSLERDDLLPPNNWVRVWKVHGSVNWDAHCSEYGFRVVRGEISENGHMILPSHKKYDESRKQPYTSLIDRLGKVINREHSLLITAGYSFGDDHINSIIFTALDNMPTANVISLQYQAIEKEDKIVKWAKLRSNLTVIAPNAGVIGGRWGKWRLLHPVDNKTFSFMDCAFDSNAAVENDSEGTLGKMRIGDFNWFCKFLATMSRHEAVT